MAHSLSAKKRMRQNEARQARNRARRTALKTKLRKCRDELLRGTGDSATSAFRDAARALDVEASRRTIHPNAAARRKSRLAKRLNAVKAKSAS